MKYQIGDVLIAYDRIPVKIVGRYKNRYVIQIYYKTHKDIGMTSEASLDQHCSKVPLLTGGMQ